MKHFLTILIAFIALSCSTGNGNTEADQLTTKFREVMEVHDRIMPRVQEVRKLSKRLDSIRSVGTDSKMDAEDEFIQAAYDSLSIIETEMMEWMHAFEAEQAAGTSTQERMQYLEEQRVAMEKVGQHFDQNIHFVENFLK